MSIMASFDDLLEDYKDVKSCEYKGRHYLARDNGAICRLPKENAPISKWDNVWSFGTKDKKNGYMVLTGNIRVHQVVCTAFFGEPDDPHMVVDHKDTNRCNNRPENLQWVTRLENALNNPATRKKIAYLCGGDITKFIEDPSVLRNQVLSQDVAWMRTVTKEEAEKCKRNIERWAAEDSASTLNNTGKGIGDFIFNDEEERTIRAWNDGQLLPPQKTWAQQKAEIEAENQRQYEQNHGLKDSLTSGAKQLNWTTPTEYLLCPNGEQERTLDAYMTNLEKGSLFSRSKYGDGGVVIDCGYNPTDEALYVLTYKAEDEESPVGKPWALCKITLQDGYFIHENCGSFFHEDGGHKYFTLAMGQKWTGGEVYDDCC